MISTEARITPKVTIKAGALFNRAAMLKDNSGIPGLIADPPYEKALKKLCDFLAGNKGAIEALSRAESVEETKVKEALRKLQPTQKKSITYGIPSR